MCEALGEAESSTATKFHIQYDKNFCHYSWNMQISTSGDKMTTRKG